MRLGSLIDGEYADRVAADSRGLAYGDGLFETLLVQDGRPVWWGEHLARLRRGCEALGMRLPDPDLLEAEARCQRILSLHPALPLPAADYREGVSLRWCETRLALQPRLAGIKHLNRLENVLARAELAGTEASEGLLRDTAGRVVCATASNVFIVRRGRLLTPALRACGIAGICRDWLLTRAPVEICELLPADIERADGVFVCSSLRGILPVARLGARRYRMQPLIAGLMAQLWQEVPALAPQH
jgi:4-amino-4-deoxychorismate lyase